MIYITGDTHRDFSRLYGNIFNKDDYYHKYDNNGYEIMRDYCTQNEVMNNKNVCCPACVIFC